MALSVSITPVSSTAFSVTLLGTSTGNQYHVYHKLLDNILPGTFTQTTQDTQLNGDGTVTVSNLPANSHILVWVIPATIVSKKDPIFQFISLNFPSTLLSAVKDKWYGTPALTSLITGGLYLSQVPDTSGITRVDIPYATCDSDRTRFEWTQTKLFYEITTLEFNVWTTSASSLEQMILQIRQTFDWQTLSFSDGVTTSSYVQPLSYDYSSEIPRDRDNFIVYRATIRYEAWINRTFSPYQ